MTVYCDYCDVFLTHDSASVRKAHNSGRSHAQNVREYYTTVAEELAEIEALEAPVKQRETRSGYRMPEPINGKGYGQTLIPGMPLPVPYGVPQRPGFPAQTIILPDTLPQVAPGVEPPVLPATTHQNPLVGGIPGSMLAPNGSILPPPNLPANFAQMQADFQARYLAGDRGNFGADDRGDRNERPMIGRPVVRHDQRRY